MEDIQKWNKRKYKDKELQGLNQSLSLAIQRNWELSKDNIALLFTSLRALRKKQNNTKEYLNRVFQNNKHKRVLGKRLLNLLVQRNQIVMAKEILDTLMLYEASALEQEKYLLEYAKLQIEEGAYKEAGQSLEQIKIEQMGGLRRGTENKEEATQNTDMKTGLKQMQFYYLWGRIERGLKRLLSICKIFSKCSCFWPKTKPHCPGSLFSVLRPEGFKSLCAYVCL